MGATPFAAWREPAIFVSNELPNTGKGVSYTCASIARNLADQKLQVEMYTPYGSFRSWGAYRTHRTLPTVLRFIPYNRMIAFSRRRNEAAFLESVRAAAERGPVVAHMWPNPDIALLQRLRDAGVTLVREMINSHVATAVELLDEEYRRLGLPRGHAITAEHVAYETQSLKLFDYVFCSNALVERSVIEHGVPERKILPTSFGWDPARFQGDRRALGAGDGVTFLFVGLICVRKGAHLLMRYWAESGIRGRLVLVGRPEPALVKACEKYLRRGDIVLVDHTPKIADYYRSADAFVFPSVEEGGPQVTYEAAGCGLPLIVSPMGAARIADETTGFVVDPHDRRGWIDAMRSLAENVADRNRFGAAARRKAENFTWAEVARSRAEAFRAIGAGADMARAPVRALEPPATVTAAAVGA